MGDLTTYSLADFFPFTPEVYFRIFERQNEAVWPAQIVAVLLGAVLIWLVWRGRSKWAGVGLGAAWIFVGYTFHLELYAEYVWAAEHAGWAFIAQGALLLVVGLLGGFGGDGARSEWTLSDRFGLVIAVFGLVVYPLLIPLMGRAWAGVELFGIASDPTVVVTCGLLVWARPASAVAWVVPLLWAVIAAATAIQMEATFALAVPVAILLSLAVFVGRAFAR
ncbi:MAG: DUF6064 family protein [Persicimonas sp.]